MKYLKLKPKYLLTAYSLIMITGITIFMMFNYPEEIRKIFTKCFDTLLNITVGYQWGKLNSRK